jgi:hypothetical protein
MLRFLPYYYHFNIGVKYCSVLYGKNTYFDLVSVL